MFTKLIKRIPGKTALIAAFVVLALCSVIIIASCTGRIGYGLVTWSVPEHALSAGDVVPVFIQSNIGKVYVVGVGENRSKRAELPMWCITLYKSKSKARAAAAKTAEYRYIYATVMLDGLPVRAKPENTARQVYRLREGEKIKIIQKGEGTPVLAGNEPLEGNWFEVMTDDGTTGWSFSFNLTVYDERDNGSIQTAAVDTGSDAALETILSRAWYPDAYRTMMQDNRLDISRINPQWGFFPGRESGVARIENADGVVTFPYTSIAKGDGGTYRFEGSSLTVSVKQAEQILVQYTDKNGMPQAFYFTGLDVSPAQLIETETARRAALFAKLFAAGPKYSSGNYGVLQFLQGGKFLWNGYQLLSPLVIPSGAGSNGLAELRCFLQEPLSGEYTGVISFTFEQSKKTANFLYILTPQGLKLEYISDSNIKDSVVQTRNLTPTVLFFTPDSAGQGGQ